MRKVELYLGGPASRFQNKFVGIFDGKKVRDSHKLVKRIGKITKTKTAGHSGLSFGCIATKHPAIPIDALLGVYFIHLHLCSVVVPIFSLNSLAVMFVANVIPPSACVLSGDVVVRSFSLRMHCGADWAA